MKWISRENLKLEHAGCPATMGRFTCCGTGPLGISGHKGLAQLALVVEQARDRELATAYPLGW